MNSSKKVSYLQCPTKCTVPKDIIKTSSKNKICSYRRSSCGLRKRQITQTF